MQANVTIRPNVQVGPIQSFCVEPPRINQACQGTLQRFCTFTVSQRVCVQIPLTFSADAEAVPAGIVCGTPTEGQCVQPGFECCAFIRGTQAETAEGESLPSVSIQLCGPANNCTPQGSHINVELLNGVNFEINLTEMISMTCSGAPGTVTVTAQANVNLGPGNMRLANFTFTFNPDFTVHIVALAADNNEELIDTTITLVGNSRRFQACETGTAL